jgi:hypothetical protein
MASRRFFNRPRPGRTDGPKALRRARKLLLEARHLNNLTAESLARGCGLHEATAAKLIEEEAQRRAGR